jgi:capsular exopolysaccharide synthesis family protein
VIAPPQIESKPVNPSLPSNLALGAMLGLAVGAAAGLLRDRFDHVFHSSSEVKQELCLPLLGHIPHLDFFQGAPEGNLLWVRELDQPRINLESETSDRYLCQHFLCQEAFRNLFTSLRFLNSEKPLRSIAISSSLLGEGKSLVAALLAKTLAEMGQRVLLIDADMRRSQLDNNLGLNNLVGLSNLLSDECLHWRNCVQSLPGFECWHVITAGLRPPDPTRLLSSKRMRDLVVDLTGCGDYDLVLFDTSPVVGLADAVLVAENCDGLVLLVSLGLVDRGLPKQAVEIIRNSGCPLLGIVTNSIKPEGAISPNRYGKSYGSFANHEPLAYSQYPGVVMPASESTQHSQARIFPTQGWRALGEKMYRIPGKLLRWLDS